MYDTLGNRTIQRAPIYIYIYTDHRFSKEPPHAASSQSQRIKLRAMFTSCKLSKQRKIIVLVLDPEIPCPQGGSQSRM